MVVDRSGGLRWRYLRGEVEQLAALLQLVEEAREVHGHLPAPVYVSIEVRSN